MPSDYPHSHYLAFTWMSRRRHPRSYRRPSRRTADRLHGGDHIGKSIISTARSSRRERLRAIGLANLIGSFAAGYPCAGSFLAQLWPIVQVCENTLAGLVTGLFVMLALVILPSFIRKLPKFVLATIVISSVVNLVAIGCQAPLEGE